MTPRENQPKIPLTDEEEDDFYYSLGQRGAKKSDAPLMGFSLVAIISAVVALSLFGLVIFLFLSGKWIYAFWILLLVLPVIITVCIIFGGVFGVAIHAFIQRYFMRDKE